MKELSIEEKAKRYDEAIERAKDYYHLGDDKHKIAIDAKAVMEHIFPTLKESEDERIRKDIVEAVELHKDFTQGRKERIYAWLEKQKSEEINVKALLTADKLAAAEMTGRLKERKDIVENPQKYGLEKQGEQKFADKVEPKFHEGDMIIHKELGGDYIHNPHKIIQVDILDKKYRLEGGLVAHFGEQDDYELVEQTTVDEVEPKFKVGDWVVYDGWTCQIIDVKEDGYCNDHNGFIPKDREDDMRLWTIQDAKDGDVLYNKDDFAGNSVFIYKGISDKETHTYLYYIRLFRDKDFSIYNDVMWGNGAGVSGGEFYPATKEQRDLLFQKMKEAGYVWDADNKELKKIEPKTWSKEDERMCTKTIFELAGYMGNEDKINWLKSIKERYT